MPNDFVNNPRHWEERAEEVRAAADGVKDPGARETLLKIAQDYERLAKRAKERSDGSAERNKG